jgi:hypothetical protein
MEHETRYVYKKPPLDPMHSQLNPLHTIDLRIFDHFNIARPSTTVSQTVSSLKFSD